MPACITCKIGPESLSLPAGLRIIDASVRGTREEAHRVGHSQCNELPGLEIEHFDGVGVHRSIHRCVFSQAEGIMQIHVSKDRKSTRLNSSHGYISYAVFCLKKKKIRT